jgi:uncharacterized protein YkwD
LIKVVSVDETDTLDRLNLHLMKNKYCLLIGLGLIITSCDNGSSALLPALPKGNPNIVVVTNLNNTLMLKLINDKRVAGCNCGITAMPPVPVLTWSNLLAAAAAAHSKDMATNNFFSHASSNGSTVADRLAAVKYNWITVAENIASGQIDEQTVIDAWIASEGHCKNIMSASIKEIGVAKESKYWTQVFATPR